MAQFNSSGWGITLGDAVKEYKRMKETFFSENTGVNFVDIMNEFHHNYGYEKGESIMNLIMGEIIADMDTARDFFRRSLEWKRADGEIPYVIREGVIKEVRS